MPPTACQCDQQRPDHQLDYDADHIRVTQTEPRKTTTFLNPRVDLGMHYVLPTRFHQTGKAWPAPYRLKSAHAPKSSGAYPPVDLQNSSVSTA